MEAREGPPNGIFDEPTYRNPYNKQGLEYISYPTQTNESKACQSNGLNDVCAPKMAIDYENLITKFMCNEEDENIEHYAES